MRRGRILFLVLAAAVFSGGCHQDFRDQARVDPLEHSNFFSDGRASREPVAGTVARGQLAADTHLETGKINGELAQTFPFEIDASVLERGRERYDIFCAVCHGNSGYGNGMVVQRGFKQPPSFHEDRLRKAPPGYYFGVMTSGFGTMYDYAASVPVRDRWAIAAYIRALQYSQNAPLDDLSPEEATRIKQGEPRETLTETPEHA